MEEEKKNKSAGKKAEEKGHGSRRDFMKSIGLVGAAAVTGGAAIYSGFKYEKKRDQRIWFGYLQKITSLLKFLLVR